MKKLFLASNQIPVHIDRSDGYFKFQAAEEFTISGLEKFYSGYDTRWIGLTGIDDVELTVHEQQRIKNELVDFECIPIFPDNEDYNLYLHGF